MTLCGWLDPAGCPRERPPRAAMAPATRELHAAIDGHARATGTPWLHPDRRTLQRDLFGSPGVVAWQEAKAACLLAGDAAWSELPHLYARYGTPGTRALVAAVRALEHARAAVVTDCGMQAVALVADVLVQPGARVVAMRQIYNKTRLFLETTVRRVGATLVLVDDGDLGALADAATAAPGTTMIFAETFTNPLVRAQDVPALVAIGRAASARLVIDATIATPWGLARPLLEHGVDVVVASLTKAIGGSDVALGGYVATDDVELANRVMDLVAMRGGILDDARACGVVADLAHAERAHARRCTTATAVARFLARHPAIERVFHPSLADHPDAAIVARDYARPGSLLAFRVAGADEAAHRHVADVLVSCAVPRYALSFDGVVTKVNHHRTVSEYFTPAELVARLGIDRLIRIGVGLEDGDDLVACLNWTLHHWRDVTAAELDGWRAERARELGVADAAPG